MKTVSVAFCFNNSYCPLAAGAISSLIRYTTNSNQYDIYIVQDDISEHNRYLINTLNGKQNVKIIFKAIELDNFTSEDINYTRHSKYAFARLFFHKLFPELDKILYLDSDIIVTSDIAEIFNQSLDGCAIGACLDPFVAQSGIEKLKAGKFVPTIPGFDDYKYNYDYFSRYLNLNDSDITTYFNSGMILLNLKKAGEKLDIELPFLLKKRYVMPDQDVLNIIFKDDKKILEQRFNVFDSRSHRFISENHEYPVVIHYNGRMKPTLTMTKPMAYRYWEEIYQTHYYYPAIENFINRKISQIPDKTNDPHTIENLFYNLKRFNKIHRRRKLIRLVIRLLVDGKKYKKLKRDPGRFFADSKNSFIRFLGRYYN